MVSRVYDRHAGDGAHKGYILVALVCCTVLAYGDARMGSAYLYVEVGIAYGVADYLECTPCRKHGKGGCEHLLACGCDACRNAHHISLGNAAVDEALGARLLEYACLCSSRQVCIKHDKIGILC